MEDLKAHRRDAAFAEILSLYISALSAEIYNYTLCVLCVSAVKCFSVPLYPAVVMSEKGS
jgi:hypothetical protein